MVRPVQKTVVFKTEKGEVCLRSFCSPQEIESVSVKGIFGEYSRYNPIISNKEILKALTLEPDANVTVACCEDGMIVGLGVLRYAKPEDRWVRVGEHIMMEVAAVEVSRAWRYQGISSQLLRMLVDHPLEARRIFFMVGYSWTWDLEGSGLEPMQYRAMMVRLFSKYGFERFQTNEPNIMMRPENLFMARIGVEVSEEIRQRFKRIRFNIDP